MGVKGDTLELISGLLWSSFILNYMLIRVKERGFEQEKEKEQREGEMYDQEKEENKALGNCLLDQNSSVEVGYGFYAIRSKLFIVNDMYWVVL